MSLSRTFFSRRNRSIHRLKIELNCVLSDWNSLVSNEVWLENSMFIRDNRDAISILQVAFHLHERMSR